MNVTTLKILLLIAFHISTGLFTGDIGMVTEEKLIQNRCLEDVDFLKTAHHGSSVSGDGCPYVFVAEQETTASSGLTISRNSAPVEYLEP